MSTLADLSEARAGCEFRDDAGIKGRLTIKGFRVKPLMAVRRMAAGAATAMLRPVPPPNPTREIFDRSTTPAAAVVVPL